MVMGSERSYKSTLQDYFVHEKKKNDDIFFVNKIHIILIIG